MSLLRFSVPLCGHCGGQGEFRHVRKLSGQFFAVSCAPCKRETRGETAGEAAERFAHGVDGPKHQPSVIEVDIGTARRIYEAQGKAHRPPPTVVAVATGVDRRRHRGDVRDGMHPQLGLWWPGVSAYMAIPERGSP